MSGNSFDANNESRSGRRRSFRGRRRALGSAVVALVLVGLLLALLGVAGSEDRLKRGVQVGGVDVGGMSRQEARQTLQKEAESELKTVSFGDGGQALSGERLGMRLDAQESVERAWEVGRDGWFGKRALDALRGSSAGVQVPAAVSYDEARARESISGFASEVRQQPVDASYEVSDGGTGVAAGEPGRELNVEQTLANLDESLESLDADVELAADEVQPEKTADELESNAPTEKLGEFETDYNYSDSKARKENLRMSSGAVDGTVLAPGQTFSMNGHLRGLDYKEAKVFAEGGESTALGGGLCQVTSTVYMAAQNAGMEIVERKPHYTTLPYIRPGFDATVWFGGQGIPAIDMKFKNTTGSNVLIREYVTENGILKAEVWGQPTGKEVTMRSEQDFKDTERGIKWSTYKTVEEDGEIVQQGQIYEDLYSFPPPEASDEGYNDVRVGGW
ncbi:MAG: VanW family protein [Rubrobacter sp.]|nr:VanW family protein [Rubrobacter sp.]